MKASFGAAPINDFDLQADPDDNGDTWASSARSRPRDGHILCHSRYHRGRHSISSLSGISLALGDFNIPVDCLGPSLVGVVLRFPVD